MIVLDTNVLAYAAGGEDRLREPCRAIIDAVGSGNLQATTTRDVIQEFMHIRARRRSREDAVELARRYVILLSPLLALDDSDLERGFELFHTIPRLGSFDAFLAAAAMSAGAEALVSMDEAFGLVPGLRWLPPTSPELRARLGYA